MIRRALPVAAVSAGLLLTLGACGGDDDAGAAGPDSQARLGATAEQAPVSPPDGPRFDVIAGDLYLEPEELSVPAGTVVLNYVNKGSLPHTLLIDGGPKFRLKVDRKGDEDAGAVTLRPGEYTLYCDIPGHRNGGMEGTLIVK